MQQLGLLLLTLEVAMGAPYVFKSVNMNIDDLTDTKTLGLDAMACTKKADLDGDSSDLSNDNDI